MRHDSRVACRTKLLQRQKGRTVRQDDELSRQMSEFLHAPQPQLTAPAEDDFVHVDQAAKALSVSRRTVERMLERGELQRDTRHDSRVAMVTKRSLVEVLESKREGAATRQSRPVSQPSPDLAAALEAIERLTDALTDERRQLMAAAEDRRAAEREREEARIQTARLQAERELIDRQAAAALATSEELRTQLEQITSAGPIRALRLRRRLRASRDAL